MKKPYILALVNLIKKYLCFNDVGDVNIGNIAYSEKVTKSRKCYKKSRDIHTDICINKRNIDQLSTLYYTWDNILHKDR